ncbi:MAG: hypothetical protein AAB270_09520 [Chloroflexota bacterium]
MPVSEDEKRLVAQSIQLKRQLVRLKSQIERDLKSQGGPAARLDGRPLDPETLPPPLREKYLQYQASMRELSELRRNIPPELKGLIDPQMAC